MLHCCCCCCWFFLLSFHQQRKLNLLWVHHETFKWIGSSKNLVDRFADKECNSQEKSMSVVVKSIQSTISIYKTLPLLLHSNMMWLFCRQFFICLSTEKKQLWNDELFTLCLWHGCYKRQKHGAEEYLHWVSNSVLSMQLTICGREVLVCY